MQPYFLDGVISFHVQLAGAPGGFNLNASTTIAAGSIGTDPEPNLVLVPKNMKSRVPKAAQETVMIIAVTFNSDDTIAYHVQLNTGTVVKLYGDKYVHDIDLIDPSAPPSLSIFTSHSLSHLKRDAWDQYEEEHAPMRAAPITIAKRGIESISSYTATFSEETCQSIRCLGNGGQPAMFNPFMSSCYCKTLAPPENSLSDKLKRSQPDTGGDTGGDPARRETDDSPMRSVFQIAKPSSETCRHLIACQGESEAYFDQASSQCLCVVYRTGVKEPVIASDTTILPRSKQAFSQEEDDSLEENSNQALAHRPVPNSNYSSSYCALDYAQVHCGRGKTVGRWNKDHTGCVCVRMFDLDLPIDIKDTVETLPDTPEASSLDKSHDWYLRCIDNIHECLNDPYAYRCDSNRKMIKRQQNDQCETNCECGGVSLAGCLDQRGGCPESRPDQPGT